jgi:hypothetical protein
VTGEVTAEVTAEVTGEGPRIDSRGRRGKRATRAWDLTRSTHFPLNPVLFPHAEQDCVPAMDRWQKTLAEAPGMA